MLLTVTGSAGAPSSPHEFAAVAADLATQLRGKGVDYEMWNEPDDTTFWPNGPQPAAYAALLKAAYPAIKAADPAATVLVGGLVANDFEFVEKLYDNGAKGSFDGVAVHTDTACLTTDPREYYREPSGRIGRYSFTGYREVRATMLAHGDDKPIWMTELGWPTLSSTCERGGRAGTKVGRRQPGRAGRLPHEGLRLPRQRPLRHPGRVVQPRRPRHGLDQRRAQPRPDERPVRAASRPSPRSRTRGNAAPIACGGTLDSGVPQVTINSPTDGQLYLDELPVSISATDDQGVTDIDVIVDGKEVGLKTVRSGKGATVKFELGRRAGTSPTARTRSSRPPGTRPRTSAARSPRSSTSAAASTPTRSRRPSSSPSARSRAARSW